MDLSLASNELVDGNGGSSSGLDHINRSGAISIEKEHMFDKVVTPSDVGKLNRLVIPKQHAEKYFPLDASSNEKGLLLNFEDRNGKPWRFRYSYWNSSQSYVMTKGWSRFVKEKKLDAGDIVSFQRGVGESGKDRLYIDWRRRPDAPDPAMVANIQLHNQLAFPQLFRWGRLYSLPQALSSRYEHLQRLNYSIYPYHNNPHQHNHYHHQPHHQQAIAGYGNAAARYYVRSSEPHQIGPVQEGGGVPPPLVIDSVPVVHGKVAAKRLRLFGVNMECPPEDGSSPTITHNTMDSVLSSHLPSSSLSPLQLRLPGTTHLSSMQADYSDKGKSSLPFDLDL